MANGYSIPYLLGIYVLCLHVFQTFSQSQDCPPPMVRTPKFKEVPANITVDGPEVALPTHQLCAPENLKHVECEVNEVEHVELVEPGEDLEEFETEICDKEDEKIHECSQVNENQVFNDRRVVCRTEPKEVSVIEITVECEDVQDELCTNDLQEECVDTKKKICVESKVSKNCEIVSDDNYGKSELKCPLTEEPTCEDFLIKTCNYVPKKKCRPIVRKVCEPRISTKTQILPERLCEVESNLIPYTIKRIECVPKTSSIEACNSVPDVRPNQEPFPKVVEDLEQECRDVSPNPKICRTARPTERKQLQRPDPSGKMTIVRDGFECRDPPQQQ